jgi:DNA repair exonuclease SbcCD ATPase subunit
MAEELILDVKTNIKSATADTKEYKKSLEQVNDEINDTNRYIIEQEKELIKLKAKQDAIPKGAWVAGMDKLNDKIRETSNRLKNSKNSLKGLKEEQKAATKENKKHTQSLKEQDKVIKDGIGSFKLFGVSINGIRKSIGRIIPTIKLMFRSIKVGIASTGLGLLLIAFGALATYLTSTKKGADKLKRVFTAIGTTISVLRDRLSDVGEAISLVFQGKWSEAADKLKESVSGIIDEVKKEVAIMDALEVRLQRLRDAENAFRVQKAETNKEIARARLLAEDETKSAGERIEHLKKALALEEDTHRAELQMAKEKVNVQVEQMKTSKNLVEDEAKLADLRVELINKETASLKLKKRVASEINTLENKFAAEAKARAKAAQDIIDAEFDAMVEANDAWNEEQAEQFAKRADEDAMLLALQQENSIAAIENLKDRALKELEIQEEKELASAELMENSEAMKAAIAEKFTGKRAEVEKKFAKDKKKWSEMSSEAQLDIMSSTAGNMIKILGEETAAGKAMAVTQATIDTYKGATAAFSAMAGIPYVGPILGGIAAGAAVVSGLANVKAILSADASGGGGGGGGDLSSPGTSAQPPAPEMLSGKFELGGGMEPEPLKAFVVTDEMTNSQDQLANIRRRATV